MSDSRTRATPNRGSTSGRGELEAGFAWRNVPVPSGVRLVGYLEREETANREVDPLRVTVAVLRLGADHFVLLCCDAIGFPVARAAEIRAAAAASLDVPLSAVWLAPSHTHSAPPTVLSPSATEPEHAWVRALDTAFAEAVAEAWSLMQPARARLAVCDSPLGLNRRPLDENGHVAELGSAADRPVDRRVVTLAIERQADSAPIGLLVNAACHPVACGRDTRYATADFPGAARAELERLGFGTCAFTLGPCGDVDPIEGTQEDPSHAMRLGHRLAADVGAALSDAPELNIDRLKARSSKVLVEYPTARHRRLEHLDWAAGLDPRDLQEILEARFPWISPVNEHGQVEAEVTIAEFGALTLVGVPYEVFAETGARIRELSSSAMLIALANGTIGYLPPAGEIDRGGYEVDESYLLYRLPGPPAKHAESRIIAAIRDLASEVAR